MSLTSLPRPLSCLQGEAVAWWGGALGVGKSLELGHQEKKRLSLGVAAPQQSPHRRLSQGGGSQLRKRLEADKRAGDDSSSSPGLMSTFKNYSGVVFVEERAMQMLRGSRHWAESFPRKSSSPPCLPQCLV